MTQMNSKSDAPPYNNVDIGTLPIPNQHVITYVKRRFDSCSICNGDVFCVNEDGNSEDQWFCESCPGRYIVAACGAPEAERDIAADFGFYYDVHAAICGAYSQVPAMVYSPDSAMQSEYVRRLADFLTAHM